MQLENMNELLFELSLNISRNVDAMFGIKRRFPALSQRDVPGGLGLDGPMFCCRGTNRYGFMISRSFVVKIIRGQDHS